LSVLSSVYKFTRLGILSYKRPSKLTQVAKLPTFTRTKNVSNFCEYEYTDYINLSLEHFLEPRVQFIVDYSTYH